MAEHTELLCTYYLLVNEDNMSYIELKLNVTVFKNRRKQLREVKS